MHLTCWRGRRGHTTLGAETGRKGWREGEECKDTCVCACACAVYKRASFLLGTKREGDGGREWEEEAEEER